jgi:hypothetical protein
VIADDDLLYRRIPYYELVWAPSQPHGWRVSSADWDDPDLGDISVYSKALLSALGLTHLSLLDGHEEYSIAVLSAKAIRETPNKNGSLVGLDVVAEPDSDDPHARAGAHCCITGLPKTNNARKDAKKPLAVRCEIVHLGRTPDRT